MIRVFPVLVHGTTEDKQNPDNAHHSRGNVGQKAAEELVNLGVQRPGAATHLVNVVDHVSREHDPRSQYHLKYTGHSQDQHAFAISQR